MLFDNYVQHANLFIREVAEELGDGEDINRALRVTRAVFHTIRDLIAPEESLQLMAQLPLILKGIYVDGWKPQNIQPMRSMREFLDHLRSKSDRPEVDLGSDDHAIYVVQCVLDVLQRHVSAGEIEDVISQFKAELRVLWRMPERHEP